MILPFNPRQVFGVWDEGYSLDIHTYRSEIVGEDSFGEPIFETIRSPLGEAIYKAKYKGEEDQIDLLAITVKRAIEQLKPNANILVLVPSSTKGKTSLTYSIADRLSEFLNIVKALGMKEGKPIISIFSERVKELNRRLYIKEALRDIICGKHVILFDDIYHSGATLTVATSKLKECGVSSVYVLTLTYTRSKR